jgi:CheY-like chemotaxis protein
MYRRALVVDDEPAICDLIQKVLLSAGLEALTLTRSAEAPGLLEEGKFDVVFLDLHMPSPDGIEIARQMRRTEANRMTPIILISDDQRPSAMSIGFEAGANFFLYKPIDKDRLLKLVRATRVGWLTSQNPIFWITSGSHFACQLGLRRQLRCADRASFVQVGWKGPKLRRGAFRSRMLGQRRREESVNQGHRHGWARYFGILRSIEFTIRILVAQFP